jgi:SAM-dependent methyltransferase
MSRVSVRQFYEAFPCGGEEEAGDRRSDVLPWWMDALALDRAEGRVLEIACGAGLDLGSLGDGAERAIGLDGAERPLRVADRRLADRANIDLCAGDAAHLPFRDGSFDGIWCIGALHHMPAWRAAVAEAGRVLRPGGTLRFLVYRRWALQTLVFAAGHAMRPFLERRLERRSRVGRRVASVAEFTLLPVVHLLPERTWLDEARRNGMTITRVERRDTWFPLDRLVPRLASGDAFADRFGRFLIVEARKDARKDARTAA